MNRTKLLLPLLLVTSALGVSACSRTPSLQGKWAVDIDATIGEAKGAGIPDSKSPQIREIYDGGQLEITSDTLVMRVAGFPEAIARDYKVVGEAGNCYKLEIRGTQGVHNYCIEGGRLIVQDPSAKLAVVYKGS